MITAVVLSHNDEEIIGKTLASLAWCDEVIVIDDESTDKTKEVAKKSGAIVYIRALKDDFAAQRNFGLSKAKHDWVLFVDSDEIVSPRLASEIASKIQAHTPDVYGYFMKRSDFMWGRELKHGETANVCLLRLAKKGAGKWVRPVHEVWEVVGETDCLSEPLLHYPHPDVAQFISEINRYSTLNAKHFYDEGKRTNLLEIMAYPAAKFFVNYVWRRGFLDGTQGMLLAMCMSLHSFLTRGKLYLLAKHI
jgi:glycosyltransferase involved in cell wall biosynthesis